jgi:carbohydrate-binding DOMON domain-containing protein
VGSTINEGAGGTRHWGWGNNDIVVQPWGHVANMYFYNRQLNLTEITQQYNYLAPRFAEITPTPTNTSTPTVTPTTTSTPTVTPTNTLTPTPTPTPTEPFFILIQSGDILTAQDGSGIEYQH